MGTPPRRPVSTPPAPWYADGLRFRCEPDCGHCCVTHGEFACVYLEDRDIAPLARYLGLSERVFIDRHTAFDDDFRVLKMSGGAACTFLDGTSCAVYDARPVQCRTFPFWRSTLVSPEAWCALRAFCPGIGRGELHGAGEIEARVASRELD